MTGYKSNINTLRTNILIKYHFLDINFTCNDNIFSENYIAPASFSLRKLWNHVKEDKLSALNER